VGQDTIQPTPIDADEYEQFRSFVADVHGRVRGHLATELENALREYRESYYGGDRLKRIEDDIATIKANVADAEADGGTAPQAASEPNSTRPRDSRKPAVNQPRGKKIEYLIAECVGDQTKNDSTSEVSRPDIASTVADEYGFSDELHDEYVTEVFDRIEERYDAEPHPNNTDILLWDDALQAMKEELRKEAEGELDDMT